MNGSVERIEREERRRVKNLLAAAKQERAEVKTSEVQYVLGGSFPTRRDKSARFSLGLGRRQLGFTRDGVAALIQRKMLARMAAEEYSANNPGMVHVKDGKPLTAHGAKLLGVSWTPA